jgi:hypothetical protein
VHEIIQHVEYPTMMACVAEIAEHNTTHWRKQLMPTVTSDAPAQLIALVCAGLNNYNILAFLEALLIKHNKPFLNTGLKASKELQLFT